MTTPLVLADWAVRETRFQKHFRLLSKGHLDDRMKPLAEYLELEPSKREGLEAFVHVTDKTGRHLIAVVSPEMAASTEKAERFWSVLQKKAAGGGARAGAATLARDMGEPAKAAGAATAAGDEVDPSLYQRVADRLLWLSGYGEDPDFFKQSLRQFVTRRTAGESDDQED